MAQRLQNWNNGLLSSFCVCFSFSLIDFPFFSFTPLSFFVLFEITYTWTTMKWSRICFAEVSAAGAWKNHYAALNPALHTLMLKLQPPQTLPVMPLTLSLSKDENVESVKLWIFQALFIVFHISTLYHASDSLNDAASVKYNESSEYNMSMYV